MKKTRTTAQLTRLKMNTGQIDWLPKNPRQWDSDDLDRTVASIIEDPDFLEDRPLIAVENWKDLVVFGGKYYNSLVFVEQLAGKIIAAGRNMTHRKVTRTHQNVLVFYKGDPREIKNIYPKIDFSGIDTFTDEQ